MTVAPGTGVAARCAENIREGLQAYLLVRDGQVRDALAFLKETDAADKVVVENIESFVGQNIAELGEFSSDKQARLLGDLLREYNRRVAEVETDGSLLIEIPSGMEGDEA